MKKLFKILLLLIMAVNLSACAAGSIGWEHGRTWKYYSERGWIKVDETEANLEYSGYKRLLNEMAFNVGVKAHVDSKGKPDYIYAHSLFSLFLAYIESGMIYHFPDTDARFVASPIGTPYSAMADSLPSHILREFQKYDALYSAQVSQLDEINPNNEPAPAPAQVVDSDNQDSISPEIKNLKVGQSGDKAVATYDLLGINGEKQADVIVAIIIDGDRRTAETLKLTGDFGKGVKVGPGKKIVWNAMADLPPDFDGELSWDVKATKSSAPAPKKKKAKKAAAKPAK
jgi:hypothetical protein